MDLAEILLKDGIQKAMETTKNMEFEKRYETLYEAYKYCRTRFYSLNEYVTDLENVGEIKTISDNMENIINFSNLDVLVENGILKKLKNSNSKKFEELKDLIIAKMIRARSETLDSKILLGISEIVDEIANNEKVDLSDLEYVGKGSIAYVYRLGNKVIKFGNTRITEKIPYHKRILQPLIRRKIQTKPKDIYIEITEYLEKDDKITDIDAYNIYKELRNDGIIWVDAKRENLGRLKTNNEINFNENLNVKDETLGYITEREEGSTVLNKRRISDY